MSKSNDTSPTSILYFDDSMLIIDDFFLINYTPSFNPQKTLRKPKNTNADFIPELTGTLIEKRLKTNSTKVASNQSELLMEHYDLLLTNLEFKLVLKPDHEVDSLITVYFDTSLMIYPLCIIPGMKVTVFNLINRSENIYKSNSMLCPSFHQNLDLLMLDHAQMPHQDQEIKLKKTLFDKLGDLGSIYSSFYEKTDAPGPVISENCMDAQRRLSLLFQINSSKEGNCLKIMAQVLKIYDLVLRLKCKLCGLLANSCNCSNRQSLCKK